MYFLSNILATEFNMYKPTHTYKCTNTLVSIHSCIHNSRFVWICSNRLGLFITAWEINLYTSISCVNYIPTGHSYSFELYCLTSTYITWLTHDYHLDNHMTITHLLYDGYNDFWDTQMNLQFSTNQEPATKRHKIRFVVWSIGMSPNDMGYGMGYSTEKRLTWQLKKSGWQSWSLAGAASQSQSSYSRRGQGHYCHWKYILQNLKVYTYVAIQEYFSRNILSRTW